jgi:hypothetical protein
MKMPALDLVFRNLPDEYRKPLLNHFTPLPTRSTGENKRLKYFRNDEWIIDFSALTAISFTALHRLPAQLAPGELAPDTRPPGAYPPHAQRAGWE